MNTSLIAKLGLNSTQFEAGITKARGQVNTFGKGLASLGGLGGAAAFVKLGTDALKMADDLSTTAATLRTSAEDLQVLRYNAQQAGVATGQLDAALIKANTAVQDAASGNKTMADNLARLGLNAHELLKLPLAQRFEAIAKAQAGATNQSEAYLAVSKIFGEDAGPKVMASLDRLAQEGFPAVAAEARKAGAVMSEETIAGLDKADKAIAAFRTRMTVAMGTILVNFSSAEGLKLLGLQFMAVVGKFGAGVLDAINEAAGMSRAVIGGAFTGVTNLLRDGLVGSLQFFAERFNSIIPKVLQDRGFKIDVASLEALKSNGQGVADSITTAIAQTTPSTFKKDVGEFWDDAIAKQQAVVKEQAAASTASTTALATTSTAAAEKIAGGGAKAAVAIADAGQAAGSAIKKAAGDMATKLAPFRSGFNVTGAQDAELTDAQLQEKIRNLTQEQFRQRQAEMNYFGPGQFYNPIGSFTDNQLEAAQQERIARSRFRTLVNRAGESTARNIYSVADYERLSAAGTEPTEGKKTNNLLEDIAVRLRRLVPRT